MNTKTKNRPSRSSSGSTRRNTSSNHKFGRSKFNSNNNKRRDLSRSGGGGRRGGRKIPTFDPSQFINTNPVNVVEETYKPKHNFGTFGLNPKLVEKIASLKLEIPSPIQDQIIPEILKGNDVIGIAETGTGKTAAFLIPLIEKTIKDGNRQTLILAPTRELALQINEELLQLSRGFGIYSTVCVGGINIRPQIKSLSRKNHFVIGTPGRVLDLIKRKSFVPSKITTVVLDEADRMLDMGFINDMRSILSQTPQNRETLFFSATITKETEGLVHDFLRNPTTISVKKKDVANNISQDVVRFEHNSRFEKLLELLLNTEFKRVLIFGAMKHSVAKLATQLTAGGVLSESIHGNKSHIQRQRALKSFKEGKVRILVATDVAARGIHIDNVTHVINYDLPSTFEDYVHRIGRTGRGTNRGKALTFISK
ncbi:DEAD/DEAH box helicase [Patescibacteria group bacterium]|nr:DEAD/DEAH box helicase [Patescibacteria group bacterium]